MEFISLHPIKNSYIHSNLMIADLAAAPKIQVAHIAEAVQYRTIDRMQ